MILNVYVPKLNSSSAIGSKDLESFYERLRSAAGRLMTRYPTSAMAALPADELQHVATYDAEREYLPTILDHLSLERWARERSLNIQGPALPEGAHLTSAIGTRFEKAFPRLLKREGSVYTYTLRCGQFVVINVASGMTEVIGATDKLADSIRQEIRSRR